MLQGPPDQLRNIVNLQASHQVIPMHFDRSRTDIELMTDLPIRQSKGDKTEDFLLARGQEVGPALTSAVPSHGYAPGSLPPCCCHSSLPSM